MNFARMPGLLPALRNTFGEPGFWKPPDAAAEIEILGRFRVDPYDVALGPQPEPLNTTQTWFYVDRADIASGLTPGLGDIITIRDQPYEIVQIDADDIGELAYRLLHWEGASVEENGENGDEPNEENGEDEARRVGRPSRRDEIEQAYRDVLPFMPPDATTAQLFAAVRRAITGSDKPRPGLTDQTLRRVLAPLRRRATS